MSQHDDTVSLRHMLDHAREAAEFAKGKSRNDLDRERPLQLILARLVEVIGEAAARVSPATRERLVDVPWRQLINMRNRLIHGYDTIDLGLVWKTTQEDLPPLIAALERVLQQGN